MKFWLLLISALVIQEPASTAGLLSVAHMNGYSMWVIHILFLAATIFDILCGYYIGKFILNRYVERKSIKWLKSKFDALMQIIGNKGKVITLLVFVPILFPLSALFLPWLIVSLGEALIYVLLGEIIFWYVPEWLIVIGAGQFSDDKRVIIVVAISISLILSVVMKRVYGKASKANSISEKH